MTLRSLRARTATLVSISIAMAAVAQAAAPVKAGKSTALDRYVQAPDSHYKFELARKIQGANYTSYVLDMTSQEWRSESEVNQTIWKHWLIVTVPKKLDHSTGFLFITGGSSNSKAPERPDMGLVDAALTTNSVVSELKMVPNQPLVFADDGKDLKEDGIIAYTWDKFLRGGDERWPLRLPMTKSAVRAMDTITTFLASEEGGKVAVKDFVVSGGSKRGWTAWTTAAVDKRVTAVIPIVIDVLNFEPSLDHHYRAYGFFAPSVGDYTAKGIIDWAGTKRFRELMQIEEPYSYRDRLTMPKFVVNASGDQFFLPDSSQFYWDGLKGEKYLRYVPNADHSLKGTDALPAVVAYYNAVLTGKARPKYDWKFEKDGSITVTSPDNPKEVKLWQAFNPEGRDFRVEKIGRVYKGTTLEPKSDGVWSASVDKPAKGFTAYYVELSFASGVKYPFKFSTPVRVTPDILPSEPYKPAQKPKSK
ncbi:MAG: PhoPQ-activated pathogenicity-related family protein [Acidobacteria bacterium]|nr:PhoPQ-activated pathogenicity-related family protein [Acidobacteriota bacterium]